MDADLYDEFGNYIGPDIQDSDHDSDDDDEADAETAWDDAANTENVTTAEPMALEGITGMGGEPLLLI